MIVSFCFSFKKKKEQISKCSTFSFNVWFFLLLVMFKIFSFFLDYFFLLFFFFGISFIVSDFYIVFLSLKLCPRGKKSTKHGLI